MPRQAAACCCLNPAKVRVQIEFGQEIKWRSRPAMGMAVKVAVKATGRLMKSPDCSWGCCSASTRCHDIPSSFRQPFLKVEGSLHLSAALAMSQHTVPFHAKPSHASMDGPIPWPGY